MVFPALEIIAHTCRHRLATKSLLFWKVKKREEKKMYSDTLGAEQRQHEERLKHSDMQTLQ